MLSKKLKDELHRKSDKPRPRPLMYIGWINGKKCYVRKRDTSYFQLLEKYPPPRAAIVLPKQTHILKKQHHLKPVNLKSNFWDYLLWGSIGTFIILSVAFYVVAAIWSFV